MKTHVLYILKDGETGPPEILNRVARIQITQSGRSLFNLMTNSSPPLLVALRTPLDDHAECTLKALSQFHVPVLGFGDHEDDRADIVVGENIVAEDLRSLLSLLCRTAEKEIAAPKAQIMSPMPAVSKITEDMLWLLENLMNQRIPNYLDRAARVQEMCNWIGSHLTLPKTEMESLLLAAKLWEVGKIGLPDKIIQSAKSQRTTAEESLHSHYPELGLMKLTLVPNMSHCAMIIKYQLENHDGSGPNQLIGNNIPLCSRILRIAVAREMIMEENNPKSPQEMTEYLEKGASILYDPLLLRLAMNFDSLFTEQDEETKTERVRLCELEEGMILAEDVWNLNGVKILAKGTPLNERILKILFLNPLSPNLDSVEVKRNALSEAEQ